MAGGVVGLLLIWVKPEQPLKTFALIDLTLVPIVKVVNSLFSWNGEELAQCLDS